jgi:hypothetical protein
VEAYLSTAPTDIPIFILTHFPIHFWGDRKEENADKLLDVYNKYPNLVVLWGHNHSDFDENYDKVFHPGDSIVIDENGTTREINFTYLSGGCISDAEYTGPYGGSAWVLGKGLIVTINPDKSLTYDYYTMDGEKMAEEVPTSWNSATASSTTPSRPSTWKRAAAPPRPKFPPLPTTSLPAGTSSSTT